MQGSGLCIMLHGCAQYQQRHAMNHVVLTLRLQLVTEQHRIIASSFQSRDVQLSRLVMRQGATALHMAADKTHVNVIQVLVDAGADVLARIIR